MECLQLTPQLLPDVILLDVNMPEMSGYEVCRELKKDPSTALIPVIFISALDLPEQRLEGYEAGGDEYLVKPINPEQLLEKIALTLTHRLENKALQRQTTDAVKTAMEAMTTSSELGSLIQFMNSNSSCKSLSELANATMQVAKNFGLVSCVMIKNAESIQYFGCIPDSLEAKVLSRCSTEARIFDFGARSVFSEQEVSILIANMPLDDPSRYGRLKDHLCVLVSIANSRVKSLAMEHQLKSQRNSIVKELIQVSEGQLKTINTKVVAYESQIHNIMSSMIDELEQKLLFLGLEEDQEAALMELASDTSNKVQNIENFADDVERSLNAVLSGLYKIHND
jgi:CheY-like chemotaxis protein